jgi:polar amino acid transport system substrate-binding protein
MMKRGWYMIAGALLVVLMIGAGCTTVKNETGDKLVFYTDQYPPLSGQENGTPTGIMVDMLNATMTGMGRGPADIKVTCWTSAYQTVLSTPNTVLFSTSRTSDREQLFKWAGPVLTDKVVAFSYRERPVVVNSTADLKHYRIGAEENDAVIENLLSLGVPKEQIVIASDPQTIIRQVQNGTTDLFAFGEEAGNYWIAQSGTSPDLFSTVATIGEDPVYYAFNRNTSDQTVRTFQQALNRSIQKDLDRVLDANLPERGLARLTYLTEDFQPFNYMANGTVQGSSTDLLRSTLSRLGVPANATSIKLVPWTEGYADALNRNDTVLFSTFRTPERENLFQWVGPIGREDYVLFADRTRNISIANDADLARYRIGTVTDDAAVQYLADHGVPKERLVLDANATIGIQRLASGQIDLFAYAVLPGRLVLNSTVTNPEQFQGMYTIGGSDLYYAFNRNVSPALVRAFQQALNQSIQSNLGAYSPERGLARLNYLTEESRPYNFVANGTVQGISVDLLNSTLSRLGVPANATSVRVVPWNQGYTDALTKNDTVLFATARNPERENLFQWAGPIGRHDYVLFADRTRSISIANDTDLARYRIGAVTGDVGVKYLADHGVPKDKLVLGADAPTGIQRLASGEIDLFADSMEPGQTELNSTVANSERFQNVYTIGGSELYYAFNRNVSPELVRAFQQGLDGSKNQKDTSGVSDYERIMEKYAGVR